MPRPRALPAALAALSLLAACGGGRDAGADADNALSRDLTLASSTTRPALDSSVRLGGDTAATRDEPAPTPSPAARPEPAPAAPPAPPAEQRVRRPAPSRPAPEPVRRPPPRPAPAAEASAAVADATAPEAPAAASAASAAGAGAGRSLAAGTLLAGTLGQRVCTESNRPGDRFVATLGSDVAGPGGATLPAGTPIVLELARASADPPSAEFVVRGVSVGGEFVPVVAEAQPVTGAVERQQVVDKASSAKGKAVQGAIAGAILGRVLGGSSKGAIIGAAGGAAAGAAMGRGRSHEEACFSPGAAVRVRLTEALAVR
jgi:hypothetical protein